MIINGWSSPLIIVVSPLISMQEREGEPTDLVHGLDGSTRPAFISSLVWCRGSLDSRISPKSHP